VSGDLSLSCGCGALRGALRGVVPARCNRLVCYCDDCQSFAWWLDRESDVLDAHGGTEILQTSPARLEIFEGRDRLACLRLTPKGLYRWYAKCCKTPLCNTAGAGLPFVGVLLRNVAASADDGRPSDEITGPVRGRVNARFARGDRAGLDAFDRAAPPGMLFRFVGMLLASRLRGDQKRSPLFDSMTRAPVVAPRVLSGEELRVLEARRDAG
jgi:hypothetical protein